MIRISVIVLSYAFLSACGSEREVEPKTPPVQKPIPTDPGKATFADVTAITDVSCKRCHVGDQFLKTEAGWRGSKAATRAGNASMPPSGTTEARNITAAERAFLVSF